MSPRLTLALFSSTKYSFPPQMLVIDTRHGELIAEIIFGNNSCSAVSYELCVAPLSNSALGSQYEFHV